VRHTASRPTPGVVFKALGNPTRLTLVRTLQGGEHCVCPLVEAGGVKLSGKVPSFDQAGRLLT
jgi:DNA-binding transcriptional ArsR family regulator